VKDALSAKDNAERVNCDTVATWSPTGSSAKAAHLHDIERSTTAKIPPTRCFAGREWCADCPLSVIKAVILRCLYIHNGAHQFYLCWLCLPELLERANNSSGEFVTALTIT
jgi:hypothetical protein